MISEQQSPFISAFILGYEVFHALTLKRGRRGNIALKIDMAKAYDLMEWDLILLALKMFGFGHQWINWIKECLSLASYSILQNGSPFGFITPSRGLRQGDPLSLFLFVIGMEILSHLLDKAHSLSLVNGIRLNRGGPSITHLL